MGHDEHDHGGTLRLYGPASLEPLDPVAAHRMPTAPLTRLFSRQLFGYRAASDGRDLAVVMPVPDLALDIPSTYNTGMGASHLNYAVHLRPGVFWDTTPPRPVTSADVVRGLKRLCNPLTRSPALPYFASAIRGMARFRDDFARAVRGGAVTARDLAAFQHENEIEGVFPLDDQSLVIEVERPTFDLVQMLALPCAAPAPEEYDAFLPGSAELGANLRSNGPFRLTGTVPGAMLRFTRNPLWDAATDPLRHQRVDAVEIVREPVTAEDVSRRIADGRADLPWGSPIAAPDAKAPPTGDDIGYRLDPCLVCNMTTMSDARVRQAVAASIDRTALASIVAGLGPGRSVRVAGCLIPPGNDGHRPATPPPPDVDTARALLAAAGQARGVELTLVHPDSDGLPQIAESCAADLERAGIAVRLLGMSEAGQRELLRDPDAAWDLALTSWSADWHYLNGRVFLQPMAQTDPFQCAANHGRYSDPEVDGLIDAALASFEDARKAEHAWQEVERRVTGDAAVIPLLHQRPHGPWLTGDRVNGAVVMPALGHAFDLTSVWLA